MEKKSSSDLIQSHPVPGSGGRRQVNHGSRGDALLVAREGGGKAHRRVCLAGL
jgi:hypothetical protein